MNLFTTLKLAMRALWRNKVRTLLTMAGIVFGIGAVIAMVSGGQGAQQAVKDVFQSLGTNVLILTNGSQRSFGAAGGAGSRQSLTWEDLEFLRSRTTLPIALKGILHPDDARAAREHGVDAIVVSNHGGRQVDGAIASLDALPAIVDAVGGEIAVLLDSGVRSGADVVKALALGADAVLVGRPYIWGLAVGGEAGVLGVLRALLAELDLTIGLSGHTRPGELHPGVLVREGAA